MERQNYFSGSPLEKVAGYSRMVKIGNYVAIGGTTAITPEGEVVGETAYEQAKYIYQKFLGLLERAGASAKDVFRIKGYLTDMSQAKLAADAYSEIFKDVRPLFTMVGTSALNRPTQLIELEMEAYIGCNTTQDDQ